MEYTQIRMNDMDVPDRFNRLIAIKGDPNLYELGAILGLSVNADFSHCYMFMKSKLGTQYIPDLWFDTPFPHFDDVPMSKVHLSDLKDHFIYEYDTGESFDFDCKVFKRKIEYFQNDSDEYPVAFVIKGKGQGIFENGHGILWEYFDGLIDPESGDDEENENYLPINMDFEKFGDFDNPLDLSEYIYYQEDIEPIVKCYGSYR